jgi:serine/threonine protein kinase
VCQGQNYDYKSDIWALGCILYEICALQQAWSGSNLLGLVYKIVQEKQPPLPAPYSDELKYAARPSCTGRALLIAAHAPPSARARAFASP